MKIRKIAIILFLIFSICLILVAPFKHDSLAQTADGKQAESLWKIKLYEKDVKYENYACGKENSEIVSAYFKEHPLKRILPICHNDCPVIKCRPVVRLPAAAKIVRASGKISVHVLVDEKGKALYARVLGGHPLLWLTAQKAACETQFKEYPFGKHQGIMHFTVNGYEFLEVPNTANEVW